MKKSFVALSIFLATAALVVGCNNNLPTSTSLPSSSISETPELFSYKISITGEGSVKAYKDGITITEDNFAQNVEVGDSITLVITPNQGYEITSVSLNGNYIAKSNGTYTFTCVDGENHVNVIFSLIETNNDDFTFAIEDNQAIVTGYQCSTITLPSPVVIPNTVTLKNVEYKVTGIADYAFSNTDISCLRLGSNIKSITPLSFANMNFLTSFEVDENNTYLFAENDLLYSKDNQLVRTPINYQHKTLTVRSGTTSLADYSISSVLLVEEVILPDGLKAVGNYAFYFDKSLSKCDMPDTVESIGDFAFRNCQDLNTIDLGISLNSIGSGAFYTSGITTITFPSTLKTISEYCFYYCKSLKSIYFNEGLETIEEQAFISTALTSVTLPNSLRYLKGHAFETCSSLTNITLNDGLLEIGDLCFSRSYSLTKIEIPSSVTTMGINPFSGITRLGYEDDSFTIRGNNPNFEIIDGVLFSKGDNPTLICYPVGKIDTSYTIPNGITTLAQDSFIYQRSVKTITIPVSVTDINGAFVSMYTDMTDGQIHTLSIVYLGTSAQFRQINLHGSEGEWHSGTTLTNGSVTCSDGQIIVD